MPAPLSTEQGPVYHDPIDDDAEGVDSPYCECDLEPIEDEDASNTCFCCGRPLQ